MNYLTLLSYYYLLITIVYRLWELIKIIQGNIKLILILQLFINYIE